LKNLNNTCSRPNPFVVFKNVPEKRKMQEHSAQRKVVSFNDGYALERGTGANE
jgi:hypothetical protein